MKVSKEHLKKLIEEETKIVLGKGLNEADPPNQTPAVPGVNTPIPPAATTPAPVSPSPRMFRTTINQELAKDAAAKAAQPPIPPVPKLQLNTPEFLKEPVQAQQSIQSVPATVAKPKVSMANMYRGQTGNYVIKPGDTLTKIAKQNGTTVQAILAANPAIKNPNAIMAGAKLNIPGSESVAPKPNSGTPEQKSDGGTKETPEQKANREKEEAAKKEVVTDPSKANPGDKVMWYYEGKQTPGIVSPNGAVFFVDPKTNVQTKIILGFTANTLKYDNSWYNLAGLTHPDVPGMRVVDDLVGEFEGLQDGETIQIPTVVSMNSQELYDTNGNSIGDLDDAFIDNQRSQTAQTGRSAAGSSTSWLGNWGGMLSSQTPLVQENKIKLNKNYLQRIIAEETQKALKQFKGI